ncbi:MAG: methionine synthase, partial [Actinobacteria bacterium]|nr:methionine synthase [Actinomycetota bacterium]
AAKAAIEVGVDYVCTMSFDTAGRTMMGLQPGALESVFADLPVRPLAVGANCGVGASDILVSLLEMGGFALPTVSKGNCGIPRFEGTSISYSGTPDLMARYAAMAADAGAAIVGGCCGTSPEHLASMHASLSAHVRGAAPTVDGIVAEIGPLTNSLPGTSHEGRRSRRRDG